MIASTLPLQQGGAAGRVAPGPKGSLFMGSLAEYKRDPIGMLQKLRREYGDFARCRLGPYVVYALANPAYIRHVLQDNNSNYIRGRFYERFKLFFGNGLLTTDGKFWFRHRRIAQPLFHRRRVEAFSDRITSSAELLIERWSTHAQSGAEFDILAESMWYTLSVLGKVIFNVDLSNVAERIGPAVRLGVQAMMPQGNINDFIPTWAPTRLNRSIWSGQAALRECMQWIIDEHKTSKHETEDLISLLLQARDEDTHKPLSDEEIYDEVMTVFLAGHETTGSGLAWALYEISKHPYTVQRLREEMRNVLGDRTPTSADIPQLPYLAMTIQECLRIYPPIWGYTRDAVEQDEVDGFRIPAGSSVFVSPYVMHRHPTYWTNPEAFDPERFSPAVAVKRPRFAYFPFGGGPRQCIGIHLAILQLQLAVAMIIRKYDLQAVPGHPIERGALISLRPLHGIRMTVSRVKNTVDRTEATLPMGDINHAAKNVATARCPFHKIA
jgi:cytochrome P450